MKIENNLWNFIDKNPSITYPPLRINESCDVVIIGGDICGCLTAYYLSQFNIDVILLHKTYIKDSDISSNIGFLDSNCDLDINLLKELIGTEFAIQGNNLCANSIDNIENIINNLDNSKIFKRKTIKYLNSYYRDNLRKCAIINPFRFSSLLLENFIKNKGRIYENTIPINYNHYSNKIRINTNNSRFIDCRKIIFTDINFCYKLIKEWDLIEFSKCFSVVTNSLDNLNDSYFENCIIKETGDELFNYIIPTEDKRFIISEFNTIPSLNKEKILLEKLKNFYNLDNLKSEYSFYTDFAKSNDGLPYIGTHPKFKDCYFNLSIGRNPICYSMIGAEIIKDLILGKNNPYEKIFSFERH